MTGFHYSPPRVLDLTGLENVQAFQGGRISLLEGDCLERLSQLPENHFDAVITDPPYHFQTIVDRFGKENATACQYGTDGAFKRASAGFMGKKWDGGDIAFRAETWEAVLRVLKPGAHVAAFSAPKCVHKMAMAIELAGFEVRDRIIHLHDTDPAVIAFLESLSPAQADALFRMNDAFGALGEAFWCFGSGFPKSHNISKAIDKALGGKRKVLGTEKVRDIRNGNGRSLGEGIYASGRSEPQYMEREITQAATPQAVEWDGWGTALKPAYEPIVIARKPLIEKSVAAQAMASGTGGINIDASRVAAPDGVPCFVNGIDRVRSRSSYDTGGSNRTGEKTFAGRFPANLTHDASKFAINGLEARYFYSAKADADDRLGSGHPTVKPVDLMQWLCRMLCPRGGLVLDVFAGTGTTGEAAFREGMSAVLIERENDYQADIARRMELLLSGPRSRRHAGNRAHAQRLDNTGHESGEDEDLISLAGAPAEGLNAVGGGRRIYGVFADEGDKAAAKRRRR